MPDSDSPCSDRVRLSQRVVKAIQEVYRIRGERHALKEKAQGTPLWDALQVARKEQREADNELRAHVSSHGCC